MDRLGYAIKQLEKHDIEYTIKNEKNGHIHARRKTDDALVQFYAGTGTIVPNPAPPVLGGPEVKGIHNFIKIINGEMI